MIGHKSVKFIDTELPQTKTRRPDLVIMTEDGEIFHIELQSTNDIEIILRMLEYFLMIWAIYGKFPTQILLYVGDKPLTMKDSLMVESKLLKDHSLTFKYKMIDIRDIDCSTLLKSDKIEDIVLSILCRSVNMDATVNSIVGKLSQLPFKQRNDYITKLLYLADLRKVYDKVKKEVTNMPVTMDLQESGIYRDGLIEGERKGLIEGERKGLIEGKKEGLIEGIESMLEIKYNMADIEVMNRVKKLGTIEQLEKVKDMIKKAKEIEELKRFFIE
ncbi:Transposase (putative), YhgA-like protein [Candidatus Magnetoovum chiemensis]|nr:Transposase (putative), YhgA-like protein [Candidatus Magnetoovum chiemensis]